MTAPRDIARRRRLLEAFRHRRSAAIEFCDRCASVCDTRCRGGTVRGRAIDSTLRLGPRI